MESASSYMLYDVSQGLPEEEVRMLCFVLWDHVLSAYPNETHHAARRRGRLVVLALRNQLQSLPVSFYIRPLKFGTYFKPLIIVFSRSGAFCNPPIVFTSRLCLFYSPSFTAIMFLSCLRVGFPNHVGRRSGWGVVARDGI